MRLLLDTHIYLWCLNDDRRLPKTTRSIISNADSVYISSVSIWEAAIKAKLGKLNVDIDNLVSSISASGFIELSLTANHAALVYQISDYHRDPFDRILIAQAMSEPLIFLTMDEKLKEYSDLIHIVNV